jgi:short subunit dehydrogenase-like uncharacterized protein
MSERAYDVVLYGASGFVGKQTVRRYSTLLTMPRLKGCSGRSLGAIVKN